MVIENSPYKIHEKNLRLINSGRLFEAFKSLGNSISRETALAPEAPRRESLENTYRYLLKYMADGFSDPSAPLILEDIKNFLLRLNDLALKNMLLKDNNALYYSTKRMENLKNSTVSSRFEEFKIASKNNTVTREVTSFSFGQAEALRNLFNYVWTMFGASTKDYDDLSDILLSSDTPYYLKYSLVSAIILGNTLYFDADAFSILLDVLDNESDIKVKSLTVMGIVLLELIHAPRIYRHSGLKSRLLLMKEDEEMMELTQKIVFLIIQTFDTRRVDSKMRKEVIPGLMKMNPEIINKMKNLAADSEDFLSNINPEWEEMIENSGIGDKIREINDMQMEGADVMVTAFSSLKSFPFFNEVANWFLPYIPTHPELPKYEGEEDDFFEALQSVMCDSDIYSFFISLKGMPDERRNLLMGNMKMQMKQAREALSSTVGENVKSKMLLNVKHSLQDLYRFFKFYRKKNEFNDPFSAPFLSENFEALNNIWNIQPETIKLISEFYFKHKYYNEAADMFIFYDKIKPGSFEVWEKTGYCFDRLKNYPEAVQWYKKAEMINPGSQWLARKLAISIKNSGNPIEALPYYEKALEMEPDNFHLLMSYGRCLLDASDYTKALQQFYHADYIKSDQQDVSRAIAWSELMSGNYDKALKVYDSILSLPEKEASDYLNAAHTALASGDFKLALKLYSEFVTIKDIKELILALKEDSSILKELKISTSDLRLIVDTIRYNLEERQEI